MPHRVQFPCMKDLQYSHLHWLLLHLEAAVLECDGSLSSFQERAWDGRETEVQVGLLQLALAYRQSCCFLFFVLFSMQFSRRRPITGPLGNTSNSSQTTPTTAASRMSSSSSSGMFDTPAAASHKRKGSFGTPTHRHKASNGSRDFNAADMIAPSVPRAEMVLTAPVLQQRIHNEPLSDLLFSQHAVYTADACGQVRASCSF